MYNWYVVPVAGISLWRYVCFELTRGYWLEHDRARFAERRKRVYTFMKIPRELEKVGIYPSEFILVYVLHILCSNICCNSTFITSGVLNVCFVFASAFNNVSNNMFSAEQWFVLLQANNVVLTELPWRPKLLLCFSCHFCKLLWYCQIV